MRFPPIFFIPLALAGAIPATAAGPGPGLPPAFSVHDLDRDGYLDRTEYAALAARCGERLDSRGRPRCALLDFDTLDNDRDGHIGEEELLRVLSRQGHGARQGWRGGDRTGQPEPPTPSK